MTFRGLTTTLVLLAVLAINAGQVRADVTSDTPGSIVIFPKVIADGTRDTLIQLTNTSNVGTGAHCWYFDATNNCTPNNFFVDLTPQQPIVWRASSGRFTGELRCSAGTHGVCASNSDCVSPPAGNCVATPGIFLGNVPPRINFQGELKCIQVDVSGVPVMGNSLKGEALLETLVGDGAGQVSQYNGIAVQAITNPSPTCNGGPFSGAPCTGTSSCCDASGNCGTCNVQLKLDNTTYNACPRDLVVTHYAQGATDLFTGATVKSELTLVPCTEDIENDRPTDVNSPDVNAHFRVINEMEAGPLSGDIPFTCWLNISLDDPRLGGIYDASFVGTFVKTRIPTSGAANAGLLGVLEEFHTLDSETASAAVNLHAQSTRTGGDVIIVPQGTGSN
jgi:hypothetical protein